MLRLTFLSRWLLATLLILGGAWASAQTSPQKSPPQKSPGWNESALKESIAQKAGATSVSSPVKPLEKPAVENSRKPNGALAKVEPVKTDGARGVDPITVIITPAREAAARTFAERHHKELDELLTQLKKSNPVEYEKAVQELFRTSERLARTEERMPERYDLELQSWKVESRIRLLAAKLSMADSPALEQELKNLLRDRIDIRIRQNQEERERLAARIAKLDEIVTDSRSQRDDAAEKEFTRIKSSLKNAKSKTRKPAAKRGEE